MSCSETNHVFSGEDVSVDGKACQCGLLQATATPEMGVIISFLVKPKQIVYSRKLAVGDMVICTGNSPYCNKREDRKAKYSIGTEYKVLDIQETSYPCGNNEQHSITIVCDNGKERTYSIKNFEPVDKRIFILKRFENKKTEPYLELDTDPEFLNELSAI